MASYTLEDRLRSMLAEVQWSASQISGGHHICPVCRSAQGNGHAASCSLAKILGTAKRMAAQRPPAERAFAIAKMLRRRLRQEGVRLSVRTVKDERVDWPTEYWIEVTGRAKDGSLTLAEREALGRITATEPTTASWTVRAETVARMLGGD